MVKERTIGLLKIVLLLCVQAEDVDESRPRLTIRSPKGEGFSDRNFRLAYDLQSAPLSSCTTIFVNGIHQPVSSAGLTHNEFCHNSVDLPLFFQPGDYRIQIIARNATKTEIAEASVRFTIEVPTWAQHVRFHGTFDTLQTVMDTISQRQSGGYIRFGDDIVIVDGKQDQMQHVDAALQKELQDVLGSSGPGVLKTLMINADIFNALEVDMVPGNHAVDDGFALRMVEIAAQYWQPLPMTDVYSNAALSHAATSFPDFAVEFLSFLRSTAPVAFVGNSQTSPVLLRHLFGKHCAFVRAPPKNAYAAIDQIMAELAHLLASAGVTATSTTDTGVECAAEHADAQQCRGKGEGGRRQFAVVVLAMGAAGKAVQLRLLPLQVFSVDFGSMLDALQNWGSRGGVAGEAAPAWIREGKFEREAFLRLFCATLHGGDAEQCANDLIEAAD